MDIDSQRTYHHGDLKKELLRLSEQALEANQLSELSLRSLAKLAGVSHSAPYRHFKNKQALEVALLVKEMEQLHHRVQRIKFKELGPKESLLQVGAYICQLAANHPARFQLLVMPLDTSIPERLSELHSLVFKEVLRWTVVHLHKAELREKYQPAALARSIWVGLFGCANLVNSHWMENTAEASTSEAKEALNTLNSFLTQIGI